MAERATRTPKRATPASDASRLALAEFATVDMEAWPAKSATPKPRGGARLAALRRWIGATRVRVVREPNWRDMAGVLDAAAMRAPLGAARDLVARPVRSDRLPEIRALHVARIGLIRDRTAWRNRLHGARNKLVLAPPRARPRRVESQIARIETELQCLDADDPELAHLFGILTSVPGIGPVVAVAVYCAGF